MRLCKGCLLRDDSGCVIEMPTNPSLQGLVVSLSLSLVSRPLITSDPQKYLIRGGDAFLLDALHDLTDVMDAD